MVAIDRIAAQLDIRQVVSMCTFLYHLVPWTL